MNDAAGQPHKIVHNQTALILVDLQRMYLHPERTQKYGWPPLHGFESAVSKSVSLAQKCEAAGITIVMVRSVDSTEGRPGPPRAAEMAAQWRSRGLTPPDNSPSSLRTALLPEFEGIAHRVALKSRWDAFDGTGLDDELWSEGIRNLLVAGVQTNVYVESTVRGGLARSYQVVCVSDCVCADSAYAHERAIESMSDLGALIATLDSITNAI